MKNDETKLKKLIGQRVQEKRLKKGLTQFNLAELTDTSTSFISRLERGEINVVFNRLVTIANVLEVDVLDLLTGSDTDSMIHEFRMLSERDQNIVRSVVKEMLNN